MSTITGIYGPVKLKNRIKAIDPSLELDIKGIRVNDITVGAVGFATDTATERIVYINTDSNGGAAKGVGLYRTAKSTKDWTGSTNRFAPYNDLAKAVVDLLRPTS